MDKKNPKQHDLGNCSALQLGGSLSGVVKSLALARNSAGRGIFVHKFVSLAQAYLLLKEPLMPSRSRCHAKIYGKTVWNEEIPVNKYKKKINHMSKLV